MIVKVCSLFSKYEASPVTIILIVLVGSLLMSSLNVSLIKASIAFRGVPSGFFSVNAYSPWVLSKFPFTLPTANWNTPSI